MALRKSSRSLILGGLSFLPVRSQTRVNRWLRGRREAGKLRQADKVIVSYPKSGRTWLRVMLTRYFAQRYGLADDRMIGFNNFHRLDPRVPRIFFTHDNYITDYLGDDGRAAAFSGKTIVLLVRDPRDVAVSSFFHWRYRGDPEKWRLRNLRHDREQMSLSTFVSAPETGIPRIVKFLNAWQRAIAAGTEVLVVRYEDLRADPHARLTEITDYLGAPGAAAAIADAVAFGAYDNMKKLEASAAFGANDQRIRPGDKDNPESFKVRRAKVGGYRDYFEDHELAAVDASLSALVPGFGYHAGGPEQR